MNALTFASTGRVNDIPEAMIACRSYGHSWEPRTVERVPQRRQFQVTLECKRCNTFRLRLLDDRGEILANRYSYAKGYQVEGGRMDEDERNLIRLRSLQALMDS